MTRIERYFKNVSITQMSFLDMTALTRLIGVANLLSAAMTLSVNPLQYSRSVAILLLPSLYSFNLQKF